MQCTRYVPALTVTMGNYSMTDHFFVVDIPDTNVVMDVQWLYSLGRGTTDWRKLEMEFTGPDGKLVVLWGMHSYPTQTVSSHRMEIDLRHGDIAWAVELRISEVGGKAKPPHLDIQAILDRYPQSLEIYHQGNHLTRGLSTLQSQSLVCKQSLLHPIGIPKPIRMRLRGPSGSYWRWATSDRVLVHRFFSRAGEEGGWDSTHVHCLQGPQQEDIEEPISHSTY